MSRRLRTTGRFIVVAVAAIAMTAACGDEQPKASPTTDRPSMESIIDDYSAMQTEMQAAVDDLVGPRDWTPGSHDRLSRSACRGVDDDEGEEAGLPSSRGKGSLVDADRQALFEAVRKVGRAHGFDKTGTTIDEPDDLRIYGEDAYGGRYVFGSAVNTVIGVRTGCHRWEVEPAPAPAPTGVPDHAKKDEG